MQFLSRLLERVGIFYYFLHEQSNHKLVLSDEKAPSVKTHDMLFQTASRRGFEVNEITSWENRYRFRTGNVAFSDFDYRESGEDLTVEQATSKGHAESKNFERYHYPVPYQTSKLDVYGTTSDGKNLSKVHMEVVDSERHVVHASSVFRELLPVHLVKISEQKRGETDEGSKFLVVSVDHEMRQDPLPKSGRRQGRLEYENTFTCLPSSIPYRPPHVTPEPRMPGPQTAIVVGAKAFDAKSKSDQEVLTDKLGRIKVQFPWDRRLADGETKFEDCSCWIRVSHGAAGAGWGVVHIPRKGEEVIVDFLNGNPNEPIITGCVYNKQNKHPYALHDSKPHVVLVDDKDNKSYLSGFKSCSGKDGDPTKNYNELRFQDRKGKEHIYFHAERDFVRVVENRDVLIVSDKKDITDDRIEKLTKDTKDGSQSIEIFKHRITTIQTGDEKLTVEEGDRIVTVKKGDDKHEVTKGDRLVEIKDGKHNFDVAKDFSVLSGKNVVVEAKNDKIELVVGQSSITMKKDGTITIKGKAITLDAMQTVKIKAMQKGRRRGHDGRRIERPAVRREGSGESGRRRQRHGRSQRRGHGQGQRRRDLRQLIRRGSSATSYGTAKIKPVTTAA